MYIPIRSSTIDRRRCFFHQKPSSDQEIAMFQQIIQFMEARGYHQVLVNTFSKVHHAPPLPTAMHLRSCLLGIGPSATSFLDDMNHKNIPDIQQYQEGYVKMDVLFILEIVLRLKKLRNVNSYCSLTICK